MASSKKQQQAGIDRVEAGLKVLNTPVSAPAPVPVLSPKQKRAAAVKRLADKFRANQAKARATK